MSDQDVNNVPQIDFTTRKSSNKDGNSHDERSNFLVGGGRRKTENRNKSLHRNLSEFHNTELFQGDDDIGLHHTLGGSVTNTTWSNIKRVLTNPHLKVPHGYKLTYQKEKEMGLQSSSSYTISTEHNDFNIPQEVCCRRWETESNGTQSFISGYSLHIPEKSQENVHERQIQRAQMHQPEKRLQHIKDSRLKQVGSPTTDKKPSLIHENIVIIQTPKEIMRNIIGESREISEDEETIWETGTQNTKNTRRSDSDIHKKQVSSYETSNIYTHRKQEFVKENSQNRCISDINNNKGKGVSKTSIGSHTKLTFKTETSRHSSRSLRLSLESATSSNRIKMSPSYFSLQSIRSMPQVQEVDHAINRERILETIQEGSIMISEEPTYMPTSYLHTGQENGMQSNESSQSSLILKWYLSSGKKLRSLLNPEPQQAHKDSTATYQYEEDKSTPHEQCKEASNIKSMWLPQGSVMRKEISNFHRTLSPEMEEKGFHACASKKSTERQKNSQQRISWETTLVNKWNSWISQRNSQSFPYSKSEVKNLQSNSSEVVTEQGPSLIQDTTKCAPKTKLNDNMKTDTKNEFMITHLETRTMSDNITDANLTTTQEKTPQKNAERDINTETDFTNANRGLTTVQKLSSIKNWFQQRAQISSVRNQATNKKLENQNDLEDKKTSSQNSHMVKKWTDKCQSLKEKQINQENSLQGIPSYENVLLENKITSSKEKHNKLLENTVASYSPRGLYTVTSNLQPCSPHEHNYEMNLATKKENSKSKQLGLAVETATKLRNTLSITSQEISTHRMEQKRNLNKDISNKLGKDDRSNLFTASKPNFITRWFQHDATVNQTEVPGTSNSKKSLVIEESKLSWLGSYVLKKCNEKCHGFMEMYKRLGESKNPHKKVIEETCKQGGSTEIYLESKKGSKLIMRKSASSDETVNHTQPNFKISLSNQEKHKSSLGSHDPKDESNLNLKHKSGRKNKQQTKSLSTTRYSRSRYNSERNKSIDENLRSVSSCSDVCSISGEKTSLVHFRQHKKGRSKISQRAKIKKLQIPRRISLTNAKENGERRNIPRSRSGSNRTLLVWCSPNTESLCTVPSFSSTELCERFIQSIEQRNIAPEQFSDSNIILEEKRSHITNRSSPVQSTVAIFDTDIKNRKLGTDEHPMKKKMSKENSPSHFIRYTKNHKQKKIQSDYICLHMRDISRNRNTPEKNEITLNPPNPPRISSSSDGSLIDCLDPKERECQCDQRKKKSIERKSSTFQLRENASNTEKQNEGQSNKHSPIGKEKVPETTTSQSKKCPLKKRRAENHNYSNESPRRIRGEDDDVEGESLKGNQQTKERLLEYKISQERGTQVNGEKERNQPHKTQYSEREREQDYTLTPRTKKPSKYDSSHEPSRRRKEKGGSPSVSQQRRQQSLCRKTSKVKGTQTITKKKKLSHKHTQYPEEPSRKEKKCPLKRKSTSKHDNLEKETRKTKPEGSHNVSKQRRKRSSCRKKSSKNTEDYSSSDDGVCHIRHSKSCPATKQTTCCVCSPENNQSILRKVTEDKTSQTDKEERKQSSKMTQYSKSSLFEGEDKSDMAGSTTKKCSCKRVSIHGSSNTSTEKKLKNKRPSSASQHKKKKCTRRKKSKEKGSQTVKEPKRKSSNKTTQYSQRDMKQSTSKTKKCPFKKASKYSTDSVSSSPDKIPLCQCPQEKKILTDRKKTKDKHSHTDLSSKSTEYSQSSLTRNNKQSDSVKSQYVKCRCKKTSKHDCSLKTSKHKQSHSFTDISLKNIRSSRSCPVVKISGCVCSEEIKQSRNRKPTKERASQTEKQTQSTKMTQYSDKSLNKGDEKLNLAPSQRKKCPFKSSTNIRVSNSIHQPPPDKCADKKSLVKTERKPLRCICTHKTRRNDEIYLTTETKKRKCPFKKNTAKDERRASESDSNLQRSSSVSKKRKLLVKQCVSHSDSCPNLNAMESGSIGSECRKQSKTRELSKKNSSLSHERWYTGSCSRGESKESSADSLQTRKSYQMNRSKKAKQRKSKFANQNLLCLRCAESCPGFQKQKSAGICPVKGSSSISKENTTVLQQECLCAKKYNESVGLEKRKSGGFCPFKKSSPASKDEVTAHEHVCSSEERINQSASLEKKKSKSFCPFKKSSSISNEEITTNQHKCSYCAKMRNKTTAMEKEKPKGFSPRKTTTPKNERLVHKHECLCAKKNNESVALEKRKSRVFCPFKKSSSTTKEEITATQCKCSQCAKMTKKTTALEKEKSKSFSPQKTTSTPKKEGAVVEHECLCERKRNESTGSEKRKSTDSCPFKKSSSSPKDEHECMHCAKMRNRTAGLERKKSKDFSPKRIPSTQKGEITADQHECLCAQKMNKASRSGKKQSASLCPSTRSNRMDYCFHTNKEVKRSCCLRNKKEPRNTHEFKDSATVITSNTNTSYSSGNSSQKGGSKPRKKCPQEKRQDRSCLKKCCRCCISCQSDDSELNFREDGEESRRKKNEPCSRKCWRCCKSCFWDEDTVYCDYRYKHEGEKKKKYDADKPNCTRIYKARKHVAPKTRKTKCSKIIQTDNICEREPQEKKSFEVICFSDKPVCAHSGKSICTNAGSDMSTKSKHPKKTVCIQTPADGVRNTKSCTFKEMRSTNERPCLGMCQQKPKVQKTECHHTQYCSSPNIGVVVERKPLSCNELSICKSRSESTVRSRPGSKFSCRCESIDRMENIKQCLEQWKNRNRLKNIQRRKCTEEAIERFKNIDFKDTLERWRQARRMRRGNRNNAQVMLTNTAVSVLGGIGGLFKNSLAFFEDAECDEECERRWKTYKKLAAMDMALEEEEEKRNKREAERIKDEERQVLRRKAEDEQYDHGYGGQAGGTRKCKKCGTKGGRGGAKSSTKKKGKTKIQKVKKKEGKKKASKEGKKKASKEGKKKASKEVKKKEKKEKKKDIAVVQKDVKRGYHSTKLSPPNKHSFSESQQDLLTAFERKQDSRLRKLHAHIDEHIEKLKRQQAKREKKNAEKEKEADKFHQLMHSIKTKKVIKEGKQNKDLHKIEIDYLKKKIKSEKEKYKKKNMEVQMEMDKAIEHQLRKLRESNEIRKKKVLEQIQEIEKQNQLYNKIQQQNKSTENKKGESNKAAAQRKVAARKEYLRKVKERERLLFEKFKKEQEEANEAFRKKKLEHENKAKLKIKLQQDKENQELSKLREQLRKKELQASNVRRKANESTQGRQQMLLQLIMKQKQKCMEKKTKLEEQYSKRNTKINKALNKMNILSQKYDDKIQKKKIQQCELKEKEKRAKILLAQRQQQKLAERRKKELQRLKTAMEKLDKALEKNKKMQQDKLSKINEKYKQAGPKKDANLKRQDSLKKLEAKLARKAVKRRLMMKEREQMERLKIKQYEMQKAKLSSSS